MKTAVGAPLCIEFSNTLGHGREDLGSPGALATWLAEHGEAGVGDGVLLRVGEFRALRDAVRAALGAAVERRAVAATLVEVLNAASAAAPAWPTLDPDGPGVRMETTTSSDTARILAAVARSAIELLGGPDRGRLRRCAACDTFFIARRATRVWCSGPCGNRSRVARHRARRVPAATA
jgi:predicted RNA-binding Zn ribbon-like protein